MKEPKVSIVIPVYNGRKYLQQTVEAVLCQDFEGFEILVVNDGSTDDTLDIALELQKKDNRLQILNKENTGVSAARNFGLERARSEFIVFLDADDIPAVDFLRSRINALQNNGDSGICGSQVGLIDENEEVIDKVPAFRAPGDEALQDILFYAPGVTTIPSNLMFRKEILINNHILFDTRLNSSADRLFLCKAALASKCVSLPCTNIFYRIHPESMYNDERNLKKIFKDNELFVKILIDEQIVPEQMKKEFLLKNYYMLSGAARKAGHYGRAWRYALKYGMTRMNFNVHRK